MDRYRGTRPLAVGLGALWVTVGFLFAHGNKEKTSPSSSNLDAHSSVAAGALELTRGPYLQMGTPQSIVVRWRTAEASDSRVVYGSDPENFTDTVDVPGSTTEHEVQLSGLAPASRYYYALGNTGGELLSDPEYYFVTAPPESTRQKTRIWVLGDSGTGNDDARAVRDAYYNFTGEHHTHLWVMLGDNAYSDGEDGEYQKAVFELYPRMLSKSVLWPAFGNHDGHSASSPDESGPFYEIFTLPGNAEAGGTASGTEAYYAFNYANIHFICLNSHDIDRSQTGEMISWLEEDLAANTLDWTIAYWHHPPYSKGSHNSDSENRLIEMRQNALPVLEEGGVDLVLSGHSHSYERSFLIDGHYGKSGSLEEPMILDGGDGKTDGDGVYRKSTFDGPAAHEGTVYVVAGSSGKTSGGSLDHPVMYFSIRRLGSVVLDVHGNQLNLTFLDDGGERLDYFTMIKGEGVVGIITTEVASFSGTGVDGRATLIWNTRREVNSAGFEVLRAADARGPFEKIASYQSDSRLKGAGNSETPRSYEFVDENLVNGGVYWYKLATVDGAGGRSLYGPLRISLRSSEATPLDAATLPADFQLFPNYPNPFNPSTTIRFDLPPNSAGFHPLKMEIFDVRGRKIKTLISGKYAPGSYALEWDGRDERGVPLPSGLYIYRLLLAERSYSRKMMLTR